MPVSASLLVASAGLRVASLDLCADEYLLLLARRDEIASVSRLGARPAPNSPLWRVARRYPAHGRGIESGLADRPTLLLATSGGGRATAADCQRLKIATLLLGFPQSIGEVEANMVRSRPRSATRGRADPWRRRLARLRATPMAPRDAIFSAVAE